MTNPISLSTLRTVRGGLSMHDTVDTLIDIAQAALQLEEAKVIAAKARSRMAKAWDGTSESEEREASRLSAEADRMLVMCRSAYATALSKVRP